MRARSVTASSALPRPPKHLGPAGRRLWRNTVAAYVLEDHHRELLEHACEAADRIAQAREAIAECGLTYLDDKGAPHPRPEVGIERDSSLRLARLLRELSLDTAQGEQFARPARIAAGRRYR